MELDPTTFEYLSPNATQLAQMATMRAASEWYAQTIMATVPDGADKTFALRQLRNLAMWCNVAIVRRDNGAPRATE